MLLCSADLYIKLVFFHYTLFFIESIVQLDKYYIVIFSNHKYFLSEKRQKIHTHLDFKFEFS